nr:MAG TPA: hypothetical protein [Caudoviricetes sp.]
MVAGFHRHIVHYLPNCVNLKAEYRIFQSQGVI